MDRERTVDAVVRALRRVNIQGSLFGQTVAIRLGLSETDVEALEMLIDSGAATAGRLAELLGLTTGAVTRMIDRLEQAGYVRRVPDPADRRRVIVEIVPDRLAGLQEVLGNIARAGSSEIARYSDAQLSLIGDFLARMAEVTKTEAAKLREEPPAGSEPAAPSEHAAPLGGLTNARLVVRSGTSGLTLRVGRPGPDLYKARFEGAVPRVRVRDGVVSVQYRGFFDWRKRKADIALNPAVGWSIELEGGTSRLGGDLSELDLRSLEISGGVAKVDLGLGRPRGVVPLKIVGGANAVRFERPAGVAFGLTVRGGIARAEFDGQRVGATKDLVLHSAGTGEASDRYAMVVEGGINKATVVERPA